MSEVGVRFVILSTQRSGSNWVEDRLGGHPDIEMRRHEVFRKTLGTSGSYQAFRRGSRSSRLLTTAVPPLGKFMYTADLFGQSSKPATGFRLMYDQLRRYPSLGLTLPAQGVRVIHLVRENVLATHVSVQVAAASGIYVRRREQPRADKVVLDVETLLDSLRHRVRRIDRHRRLIKRQPHIEVRYEQFVAAPDLQDLAILEFLEVDASVSLGSAVKRLGRGSIADRVENYEQLAAALRGTEFEQWLDGD